MANYLITGGAGFIGSHLVEHLLQAGDHVTVIDDFSTGQRANLSAHSCLTLVEADILEVETAQFTERFNGLAHLAALPSVNDSWTDLAGAHRLNLTATVRMLELARTLGIPKFVYASSAAVYGTPTRVPIREDDPVLPLSPYGLQKLASENYGRILAQQHDFVFVALRFFNVFGPRQIASSPYSGVISKFAAALHSGRSLQISGAGSQTRDFVYVTDVARGISQALTANHLQPFTVCNLGTGRAVSIRELAEMMRELFPDWNGSFESAPSPPGDIVHSQASITAAGRLLGFRPTSTLEAGLAGMIQAAASN